MKIDEMNMSDVQKRMAEIRTSLEGDGKVDLDALNTEMDQLETRADKIKKDAEARKSLMSKIVAGTEGTVVERHRKEENNMEKKTFAPDTVEYRNAYLKNLMRQSLSAEERTALTNAKDVIPTETENKIFGLLADNPLYAELNVMRVKGYVTMPVAGTVNDASWIDMAASATDSADTVASITLGAKKLIKTIEITADVAAMAIPAFQDWLVSALANKMVKAICAAVVKGAGTSDATGVETAVTATTITEDYDGLLTMLSTLPGQYHSNAVFVMSSAEFFTKIMSLKDSNKRPLVYQGTTGIEGGAQYMLLGHRVVLDNNVSKIILGDFKDGYVLNLGQDVTISADNSVEFRSGSTVYRAMALADGNVADKSAFVVGKLAA